MKKNMVSELEALQQISPAGAIVWLSAEPEHYHWHGHEGTFTLVEIEAQIKSGGHILLWDLPGPKPKSIL